MAHYFLSVSSDHRVVLFELDQGSAAAPAGASQRRTPHSSPDLRELRRSPASDAPAAAAGAAGPRCMGSFGGHAEPEPQP